MDRRLEQLERAYRKYSIDPSPDSLKSLQDLTGKQQLPDVFDETGNYILTATDVKPLEELERSVERLHKERSLLLDQRVQKQAQSKLPDLRDVTQHLKMLKSSLGKRIRHLKENDESKKHVELQIFHLCCRRYQEKIHLQKVTALGPQAYQLAMDSDFLKDAKAINNISNLQDPKEKLAFLDEYVSDLQDKYLPGKVPQAMLCQVLILSLSHADNPSLLLDIEALNRLLSPAERKSNLGEVLSAASKAIQMIQQEALSEV